MMSLPLNQTNPQLNDLLLRGGSSLSPELKEQAIDDILAEFGSAPAKKGARPDRADAEAGLFYGPLRPAYTGGRGRNDLRQPQPIDRAAVAGHRRGSAVDSLSYRFCAAGLCSEKQCRTGKVRVPVPRDRRDRLFGISERRPD